MFTIPKNTKSTFAKSPLKLNVAVDNLNSTVAKFTDGTYDIYSDGVYKGTAPQAKLNLVFPDLSNDNNLVYFDLTFRLTFISMNYVTVLMKLLKLNTFKKLFNTLLQLI